MAHSKEAGAAGRNLTVHLRAETIQDAKILAARFGTSVSGLVADTIRDLVGKDKAFESSKAKALAALETGFPLGGKIRARREEWHDRQGLR